MSRMSYAIRAVVITVALLLAVWADYLGYPRVLTAVGYSTLVCGGRECVLQRRRRTRLYITHSLRHCLSHC